MRNQAATYILLSGMLLLAASCGPDKTPKETIVLEPHQETILPFAKYYGKAESLMLHKEGEEDIGEVEDLCTDGRQLYILDEHKSLTAFSISTMMQTARLTAEEAGEEEAWEDPKAVASGEGMVYVLDSGGKKVFKYDQQLKAQGSFALEFEAWDLAKVKGGFIFYNPDADSRLRQVVYTDEEGKLKDSFFPQKGQGDMVVNEKVFSECREGVSFIDPYAHILYLWGEEGPTATYKVTIAEEETPKRQATEARSIEPVPLKAFLTREFVTLSFVANELCLYSFYGRTDGVTKSGLVSTNNMAPFNPALCLGDTLLGVSTEPLTLHLYIFKAP